MSSTTQLHVIQEEVRARVDEIISAHRAWPCRKGCDDCCRRLASVPIVTESEWQSIAAHLDTLEQGSADRIRDRIRDSAGASRPVVCPLLDTQSGACLVYDARPIACRAYGFYVERENILGCSRIESIADQSPDVVWGNGSALDGKLQPLGPAAELYRWFDPSTATVHGQFPRK
jgi:Fe-S-cluster containining protein